MMGREKMKSCWRDGTSIGCWLMGLRRRKQVPSFSSWVGKVVPPAEAMLEHPR